MPLADPILVLADETDDDDALAQATRDLLALARRVGTPVLARCDHRRAAAELIDIAREHRPRAILINSSPTNDRISAQVAVHLESAIITDVTDLSFESDHLVAVSDRVHSEIHTPTSVITVRPRVHEPQRELLLTEADVVVAGGRGVGSAEGFSLLARVAYALGGRLGGTHTAGELGWCPHHARISLPGTRIRPRLYLAGGISGSARHRSAIRDARTVVAIDSDPNAPILREADFAIIGDLHKFLPALLEELATRAPSPPQAPPAPAPAPPPHPDAGAITVPLPHPKSRAADASPQPDLHAATAPPPPRAPAPHPEPQAAEDSPQRDVHVATAPSPRSEPCAADASLGPDLHAATAPVSHLEPGAADTSPQPDVLAATAPPSHSGPCAAGASPHRQHRLVPPVDPSPSPSPSSPELAEA